MPKKVHDGIQKRCGCPRKKWPKCSHPWCFGFFNAGRDYRYSLDKIARSRGEPAPASKIEAESWRDRLRSEIRSGTFIDPNAPPPPPGPMPADTRQTFGDVCDDYLKRYVRIPTRKPKGRAGMEGHVALLRRAMIPAANGACVKLEMKAIAEVTRADVEAVRAWRRQQQAERIGQSRPGVKGGEVGTNRLLSRLRHLLSWAVVEGYIERTPFKVGSETAVKLSKNVESGRTRRLEPGEETALLQHATPHVRALIVAALTTGCRLDELLSLQWAGVRRDDNGQARWIVLEAEKTKDAETRVIPVGTRLRAELEMRRHAPDGKEHPPSAYVFGNEAGERVNCIRRAWDTLALVSHGRTPVWAGKGKLASESRAELRQINLHFHDLRREFGSRLLESSADIHDVAAFLGHANISTTSRYLQSAPTRLERALARMEDPARFAHYSHKPNPAAAEATSSEDVATDPKALN